MASIEELASRGELAAFLNGLDEGALAAQQIVQRGAMHAMLRLLQEGCSEQNARAMLASLEANMSVIDAVARRKGFTRLFDPSESGT